MRVCDVALINGAKEGTVSPGGTVGLIVTLVVCSCDRSRVLGARNTVSVNSPVSVRKEAVPSELAGLGGGVRA